MKTALRGTPSATRGLAGWMSRVLDECELARKGFQPEVVHDLRVALRRCRTMADSLQRIDDHPGWSAAKRSGKKVFRSLGELRDAQVSVNWTLLLGGPGDPVRVALLARLLEREEQLKESARKALRRFPASQWKTLARRLSSRAARFPQDGRVFDELAGQRLVEAITLHHKAAARPTPSSWHRVRIAAKRLRYTVENFLPRRHAKWGKELKKIQDLLGEVHDLDVLRRELSAVHRQVPRKVLLHWRERIATERQSRLDRYLEMASGRRSVWLRWRRELAPAARDVSAATGGSPKPKARPRRTPRTRKPTSGRASHRS